MSYLAQRREEEKERRRTEILDAAEALYAEIGWEASTIDEVARRARLSRALVYVYFKDKRDLHFAIVERALRELRKRFEDAVSRHERGIDKVEAIGHAYLTFSRDVPHYFDASSQFQAHSPENSSGDSNESAAVHAGQRVHEVLVAALEAGIVDGSIRRDVGDPLTTAITLWGFTHGIIQIASRKGAQLAALGVGTPALVEQCFSMLRAAMANRR
jgi:AcrR family transcriptional regulator